MNSATYKLLAACARATCEPAHLAQIARDAAQLTNWDDLPQQAEAHGVAPLLYAHLKAAGAPIPPATRRLLQGLTLRHREANAVRTRELVEILHAFAAANIPALILKGAALAHLVYPEPGLRPMRDVDVLVPTADAWRAQRILQTLGFDAPLSAPAHQTDKHLPVATARRAGFVMSVEVHRALFARGQGPTITFADLTPTPFTLTTPEYTAYTLHHEAMLRHVCHHMLASISVFTENRLIWVADMISYAERFAEAIDWPYLRAHDPVVLNTLSLLHHLTPLSETLQRRARVLPGRAPQNIGADFCGWPRTALAAQRAKGAVGILRDTFAPPEWWLRLAYGTGSAGSLLWTRAWRHPWHILGWVWHWFLGRACRTFIGTEE